MNNPNPYHAFLIKHRVYCEHPGCMNTFIHATHIVEVNGRDLAYCSEHSGRLDAARKSDRKQSEKQWNQTVDQLQPQGDPFDYLD